MHTTDKQSYLPSGIHISYYFICTRKLWLYTHGIGFEREDENVLIGKLIDEDSFSREKKGILIDGVVNIDFIKGARLVSEIKKSDKLETAHIWQLKYYLYYLKNKGIDIKGVLCYPRMRERREINLSPEDEKYLEDRIIPDIERIISLDSAPLPEKKKYCRKCAYFEFCFV